MFIKVLVLGLTLASVAFAEETASSTAAPAGDRSDFRKSLSRDCASSYSVTCLKLDIVSWVDKLNENDDYNVLPGVSVVRENASARSNTADIVAELARDFPNDPDARLDAFMLKKISGYLNTHSVKLNLWDSSTDAVATGRGKGGGLGGGGGGGGHKGGGMGGILAAAAMMKSTLGALALGTIALVAKKALFTGMVSLLISAIIGLKALTHHDHKTTYEVVSKPVYSHASTHSVSHEDSHGGGGHYGGHSSGYGRSFDVPPLPLGLQPGYKPAQ